MKLKVEDVNDNYPIFDEDIYTVLISENMTIGSKVIQVTATDFDAGVNSELTYTLTGGNGHFTINRTTGKLHGWKIYRIRDHSVDHSIY